MVVTSANSSAKALSLDDLAPFGLEAGILETGKDRLEAAATWLDAVFANRSALSAADLAEIAELWKTQRANRPARQSLTAAILSNSVDLADRELRVHLYTAEEPGAAHVKAFRQSPYFDSKTWEDREEDPFFFGEMPTTVEADDELLCFEIDRGKVRCIGVWRILDHIGTGQSSVWPSVLVKRPLGRPLGSTVEIERSVATALRDGRIAVDVEPLSLTAFATIIASNPDEETHLARIQSEAAREAYRYLVQSGAGLGMSRSYKTGRVPAVCWRDARGDYLFSFIPNKNHLLFYVRLPALAREPGLANEARGLDLEAARNPAGETTVHVRNSADAEKLVSWLTEKLPLPTSRTA